MDIQIDPIAALISSMAAIISVIFYLKSKALTLELKESEERLNKSIFYFERNNSFEGRIDDCPECLRFYGIDLDEMKRDGISHKEISYLVQGLNLTKSVCNSENISVEDFFIDNEYWQNLLVQPKTKIVWKYAQKLMTGDIKIALDKILG